MKYYQYAYKNTWYARVTRTQARKAFDRGEVICLCADRTRPDGAWAGGVYLSKEEGKTFEQFEEDFRFYNCRPETGLRIAFYTEVKS